MHTNRARPVTEPADLKDSVRAFWDATPCGTRDLVLEEGSPAYFAELERQRDELEPFIARFARFQEWKDRAVLEVGVGAATDFIRFARGGARLSGVDLTTHAVALASRRLALEGLTADVRVSDAETLPFSDGQFDLVYSWGVIHHTEDTPRAAREIVRVARPGGRVCVMVYNRHSLVSLQAWLAYALFRGRPWRSLRDVIWNHVESIGTKAYTMREARELFPGLEDVRVTPVVTPYDLRLSHSRFLPRPIQSIVPDRFGWFLVVEGRKPL